MTFGLGGVPAEFGGEQVGNVSGGGERCGSIEQMGAGASHENIVERGRHLVAGGVDGFGAEVGLAGDEGFGQHRVERDEGPDLVGLGAESVCQVGRRGSSISTGPTAIGTSCRTEQRQPPRRRTTSASRRIELSNDHVDGVFGHFAVGRQLAAVDPHDTRVADGDLMPT